MPAVGGQHQIGRGHDHERVREHVLGPAGGLHGLHGGEDHQVRARGRGLPLVVRLRQHESRVRRRGRRAVVRQRRESGSKNDLRNRSADLC